MKTRDKLPAKSRYQRRSSPFGSRNRVCQIIRRKHTGGGLEKSNKEGGKAEDGSPGGGSHKGREPDG